MKQKRKTRYYLCRFTTKQLLGVARQRERQQGRLPAQRLRGLGLAGRLGDELIPGIPESVIKYIEKELKSLLKIQVFVNFIFPYMISEKKTVLWRR